MHVRNIKIKANYHQITIAKTDIKKDNFHLIKSWLQRDNAVTPT